MDEAAEADLLRAHAHNAASVLATSAERYAQRRDAHAALSCAWIADLTLAQAWTREQSLLSGGSHRHEWYRLWERIVTAIGELPDSADSIGACIRDHRDTVRAAIIEAGMDCPDDLFADIAGLDSLPLPSAAELTAAARARCDQMDIDGFLSARRRDSIDRMIRAHRELSAGDAAAAIRFAYESDMAALDAYLAMSARDAGDHYLMTWLSRWELVSDRISSIGALPRDFAPAVKAIRTAIAEALGEPDASRLLAHLQSV